MHDLPGGASSGRSRSSARSAPSGATCHPRSAEPIQVAQVTAVGFNITRVAPVIGRPIVEADETSPPPVVVIG
jgi:hypothetical protein